MDPTRTGMIRRRFEQTLIHLFENLKKKIRRVVVDEDAFGLSKPYTMRLRGMPSIIINERQKYGAAMLEVSDPWVKSQIEKVQQSIDPSDLLKLDDWPHVTIRYGFHDGNSDTLKTLLSQERFAWVKLGRVSLFQNEKEDVLKIDVEGNQLHSMNRLLGIAPNTKTHSEYHPHLTIAYLKPGTGHKYLHRFAAEILTGTELMLHRVIVADSQRNKEEVLLNSRWEFQTTQQQLDEFMNWLAEQLTVELLAIQFNDIEKTYWGQYIRQAYEKGVGRVFDEVRGQPILTEGSVRSFYNGTKEEFLRSTFAQPVSIDRVKALAARTFTELKNVTSAMGTEMSRVLVDGLAQGKSPYDVGRDLNRAIDGIGKKRATMIARTETIRAHAEGQLDSMERLGVQEVGVMVEWSVARDSRLCPRCAALAGIVLSLKEARGLLPLHPNCRCSWMPANVGEDQSKQKRSQSSIKAAMKKSIMAEAGKNTKKRTFEQIKARSKWAGADREIAKKRPKSILDD